MAYSGEGIYLFIEQISWLMKAGAIGKEYEKPLGLISSYAELAGYLADLYLVVLAVCGDLFSSVAAPWAHALSSVMRLLFWAGGP